MINILFDSPKRIIMLKLIFTSINYHCIFLQLLSFLPVYLNLHPILPYNQNLNWKDHHQFLPMDHIIVISLMTDTKDILIYYRCHKVRPSKVTGWFLDNCAFSAQPLPRFLVKKNMKNHYACHFEFLNVKHNTTISVI